MTAGLDPRYERSALFWLRAFPRRYREVHTDEILGTLADVEPPGATRPAVATAVDLVRAGWAERLRSRPPFGRWLWYRCGGKLPPKYRVWLLDDLQGWFRIRLALYQAILLTSVWVPFWAVPDARSGSEVARLSVMYVVFMTAAGTVFGARRRRRSILRQHGLDESGRPAAFTPSMFGTTKGWLPVRRVRVSARAAPLFVMVGAALVVSFPISALTFLAPDFGPRTVPVESGGFGRESVPHLWGAGVATFALSAVVLVVTAARAPRWWRTMRDCALAPETPLLPTGAMAVLATSGVMALTFVGFVHVVPLSVSIVLPVVDAAGPALLVLGLRARAFERRTGLPVPTPFTWQRRLPEAAVASSWPSGR